MRTEADHEAILKRATNKNFIQESLNKCMYYRKYTQRKFEIVLHFSNSNSKYTCNGYKYDKIHKCI